MENPNPSRVTFLCALDKSINYRKVAKNRKQDILAKKTIQDKTTNWSKICIFNYVFFLKNNVVKYTYFPLDI